MFGAGNVVEAALFRVLSVPKRSYTVLALTNLIELEKEHCKSRIEIISRSLEKTRGFENIVFLRHLSYGYTVSSVLKFYQSYLEQSSPPQKFYARFSAGMQSDLDYVKDQLYQKGSRGIDFSKSSVYQNNFNLFLRENLLTKEQLFRAASFMEEKAIDIVSYQMAPDFKFEGSV